MISIKVRRLFSFERAVKIIFVNKRLLQTAMDEPIFTLITSLAHQQPAAKCRDRKYLAGSDSVNFPEILSTEPNKQFIGIQVDNRNNHDIGIFGTKLRPVFDNYMRDGYNAILIKNLPITNVKDFDNFVRSMNYKEMMYKSGSGFRQKFPDTTIYTASDEPPEFSIEPHNEMAYLENFPTKIFFCCLEAAEKGGESPLTFNRDIIQQLDPKVLEKLRKYGIEYKRNIKDEKNSGDYITWQSTFHTSNREEAEKAMEEIGMNWKWKENGDLLISKVLPAFLKHPSTGEEIWFNQVTSNHYTYYKSHPMFEDKQNLYPTDYPFTSCYGNGEEVEENVIDHIRSIMWKNAMSVKLEAGDVVLCDNLLCQHSRLGFEGTRRIIVHLADSIMNYYDEK